MEIIRIVVKDLFGRLDYDLPLDQGYVTIITGPNGYGKTVILKIINSFLKQDYQFLFNIKFKFIQLYFTDFTVNLNQNDDVLKVLVTDEHSKEIESFDIAKSNDDVLHNLSYYLNFDDEEREFKNISRSYKYSIKKCILDEEKAKKKNNHWLDSKLDGCEISFIKAQRLEYRSLDKNKDTSRIELTIERFAKDLSEKIKLASEQSSIVAQKLDSSFPKRMFGLMEGSSNISSISDRLLGLQETRNNYIKYDFIKASDDSSVLSFKDINSTTIHKEYAHVLNLYIEDTLEKLSSYIDLYKKVDLFVSLLNEKMLAFKTIKIDQDRGFYFIGDKGDEINLDVLSSGEQNQIVLYYDIIFNTKEESIILIDEPEISLHVVWQKEFLDSLNRIIKINNIKKVIIATHSPQIINNKWKLTVDLFDLVDGNK